MRTEKKTLWELANMSDAEYAKEDEKYRYYNTLKKRYGQVTVKMRLGDVLNLVKSLHFSAEKTINALVIPNKERQSLFGKDGRRACRYIGQVFRDFKGLTKGLTCCFSKLPMLQNPLSVRLFKMFHGADVGSIPITRSIYTQGKLLYCYNSYQWISRYSF